MVRILLIDDNETDRHLIKRELGQVFPELETPEVRDQKELDVFLKDGAFDLAITEYQLRWTNGVLVLNALKTRYPTCPVIMFTGSGNEEIAATAMKAGLDDYVVKSPKHAIPLVTAVRAALETAEARRRASAAEREREDLLIREQAARAEAERLLCEAREAEQRKDEFLAMLAHELRNPLNPVLNAVHLLRQPAMTDEQLVRVHDMLERQVKHMARLVEDLLDVTRITRGRIELRRQRLDLVQLTRTTAEDYRSAAEAKGLKLRLVLPDGPAWAWADRTRLSQVLGNLIQNSVKFTNAPGEITVRLTVSPAEQRASLEVQDTGIGIDADMLPQVFEMFTQADRSLDRSQGGLGLGLALVKGLVGLHGGQVLASSEGLGRGARFTCSLPLQPQPAPACNAQPRAARRAQAHRILVIEDSQDSAESLRLILELYGHAVQVAHSGTAGVEAAKAFRPTVVLCDLGLPGGMSGHEVARRLRHEASTSQARLIAVSGYGQPEDQAQARSAGFDLHLTKPVDPEELQRRLSAS